MSKVLTVADGKVILMLCLATLRVMSTSFCDGTVHQICCDTHHFLCSIAEAYWVLVHQILESMNGYE